MKTCIYLRKSRADAEAEKHGEGETLLRHEKILKELAKKMNLQVSYIFKEILSGESIASRPVVQTLLSQVEKGLWDAVMVMEVERLARGNTIDQGIISQTFKYSQTKIITPLKTYDPCNEFDEEYFEFGLFMSRREYKTINRRMQTGRLTSAKEGKFLGSIAPYGYEKVKLKNDKGYTLEINKKEAEVINLIFHLYTTGDAFKDGEKKQLGTSLIAKKLNELKIKPPKKEYWTAISIRDILINPVYTGKIRWNWRPAIKKFSNGKIEVERPRNDNKYIFNGLHQPIISEEVWGKAQELLKNKKLSPVSNEKTMKNPLSGLIICGKCGKKMVRRPYKNSQPDTLLCTNTSCDNISTPLHIVEEKLIASICKFLKNPEINLDIIENKEYKTNTDVIEMTLKNMEKELKSLKEKKENIYEFFEEKIYSIEVFNERLNTIENKIKDIETSILKLKESINIEKQNIMEQEKEMPKSKSLYEMYKTLSTPKAKNIMLKNLVEKVIYTKNVNGRWHNQVDEFTLTVFPKINND